MNKTQQRLVDRAKAALARNRLQSGVKGDKAIVEGLLALIEQLDEERDWYREHWIDA